MLGALFLILFLAFLVTEGIVEYFLGQLFEKVEKLKPFSWTLMYVSAMAGIGLCIYYKLDLIALLSQYLVMEPAIASGPVGQVLTGIAVGRGANFINQLIAKFFPTGEKTVSWKTQSSGSQTTTTVDPVK